MSGCPTRETTKNVSDQTLLGSYLLEIAMIQGGQDVAYVRSLWSQVWLPKTDDNDSKHKNDANTLTWHMVNASLNKCLIQAIQVTSLGYSKTCYISNIILEENNLPSTCLFPQTNFNARCWAYVAFKCSFTATITLGLYASELPPTRCWAVEQAISICFSIDLNKILPIVRTKADKPEIHFYIPVHK